jgi:hypothetical protein
MKYLKRFNESKIKDSIRDLESEYLAYLTDAGFKFNFEEIEKYYSFANVIDISKNKSGFYWEDIKYDLLPFVEALMKIYTIRTIKIFTYNNNDGITQHTYVYSSYKGVIHNIEDFINEKDIPNNKLLITIEIIFT